MRNSEKLRAGGHARRGQCETGRKGSRGRVLGDLRPLKPAELRSVTGRHRAPKPGTPWWTCLLGARSGCCMQRALKFLTLANSLSTPFLKKKTLVVLTGTCPRLGFLSCFWLNSNLHSLSGRSVRHGGREVAGHRRRKCASLQRARTPAWTRSWGLGNTHQG